MKKYTPYLFRGFVITTAFVLTTASTVVFAGPDGLFGDYFTRMTGSCTGSDEVISGFSIVAGSYGTKECRSVSGIITTFFANEQAPVGQAVLGFNVSGKPVFGDVNWTRNSSDVGFVGGRVGVGTTTPTALLDITGGDALINNLTIGRGGGNVLSNVAMGQAALQNNSASASANVGIGALALMSNGIGTQNTAIGTVALRGNTSGENNTGIGSNALQANITGGWNTAIGSASLYANITGIQNAAIGTQALYNNTTGLRNIALGTFAGGNITTGSNNIAIGFYALVPDRTADNQIRMGNALVTYAGIQVPWTITSDRTLKSDIETIPLGLDFVNELKPVLYTRNNNVNHTLESGFIAQDVEVLLEKNNLKNFGMVTVDDTGIKSIRYNDFFAPIVRSIQELSNSVNTLTTTIEKQNTEIQLLKDRLERLESKNNN